MNIATRLLNKIKSIKDDTKLTISNESGFISYSLYNGKVLAAQCKVKVLDKNTVLIGWIESNIPSRGYATKVLSVAISEHTRSGVKVFKALIDSNKNPKSVKLFKSFGFKEVVHRNDRTSDWELKL